MAICTKCNHETSRTLTVFDAKGRPVAEYCRVCKPSTPRTAINPFSNFTLQHVKDHSGNPITVNSLRELRAVEKEYNVALAVASDDDSLARTPPQHESWAGDLSHNYEKKFNRDPNAYSQSAVDEAKNNLGVVDSPEQTLVDRPNPLNR